MRELTGEREADFWIENENNAYQLHLLAHTDMDYDKRTKLISVSTSKKNDVKGFMSKIRSVFEAAMSSMNSSYSEAVSLGFVETKGFHGYSEWTLTEYKSKAKEEEWDELERSIVARLADEVRVRISGSDVEMTIEISF